MRHSMSKPACTRHAHFAASCISLRLVPLALPLQFHRPQLERTRNAQECSTNTHPPENVDCRALRRW